MGVGHTTMERAVGQGLGKEVGCQCDGCQLHFIGARGWCGARRWDGGMMDVSYILLERGGGVRQGGGMAVWWMSVTFCWSEGVG